MTKLILHLAAVPDDREAQAAMAVALSRKIRGVEPTLDEVNAAREILGLPPVDAVPEPPPTRTPEEQDILDAVAQTNGQAWVDAHAEFILDEARQIGDLPQKKEDPR